MKEFIPYIIIFVLLVAVYRLQKMVKRKDEEMSGMYNRHVATIELNDLSALNVTFFIIKSKEIQFHPNPLLNQIVDYIASSMNATRRGDEISFDEKLLDKLLRQRGIYDLVIKSSLRKK